MIKIQLCLVLLLSSAALFSSAFAQQESEDFDCTDKPNGQYPNPYDCASFWKCVAGTAYLYQCHPPQLYNPVIQVCDWPDQVKCTPIPEPTDKPTEEPSTIAEPSTAAPTTVEPSTVPPTTAEPSTAAPTTAEPTTAAPTTAEPTTAAPTTAEPSTAAPTTAAPTTAEPSTAAPTTAEPSTAAPTTAEPSTAAPTTVEPSTAAPTTEEAQEPTTGSAQPSTEGPGELFNCTGLENDVYPNPADCYTFYYCSNNYAYLFDCPEELVFNPVLQKCDWVENVPSCAGTGPTGPTTAPAEPTTTEAVNPTTTETPVTEGASTIAPGDAFNCTGLPNNVYPNPVDCYTFYYCSNGYTYLYDCPEDLVFNPALLQCDWIENVPSCGGQPTTTEAEQPTTTEVEQPTTEAEVTTEAEQPSTTQVEQPTTEADVTTEAEQPTTEAEQPTTEAEQPTTEAEVTTEAEQSTTTEAEQPTTVASESTTEAEQPTTEAEQATTSDPGFSCDGLPCGRYPVPDSCQEFYECSENEVTLGSCPQGLAFNAELSVCDFPQNVPGCSVNSTPVPTTAQPTTTAPVITDAPTTEDAGTTAVTEAETTTGSPSTEGPGFCSLNPSGLYPNPGSCKTFIHCSNGYMFIKNCPSTLVFNPDLLVCDWPANVPSCNSDGEATETPEPEVTTAQPVVTTQAPVPTTAAPAVTTEEAATTTEAASDPPTTETAPEFSCDGKPSGLYPNPTDCHTFYKCSNGYKYLYDCPSILLFNPTLLVCDWPENAGCSPA